MSIYLSYRHKLLIILILFAIFQKKIIQTLRQEDIHIIFGLFSIKHRIRWWSSRFKKINRTAENACLNFWERYFITVNILNCCVILATFKYIPEKFPNIGWKSPVTIVLLFNSYKCTIETTIAMRIIIANKGLG